MARKGHSSAHMLRLIRLGELVLLGAIIYVLMRAVISYFAPSSLWPVPPQTDLKLHDYHPTGQVSFDRSFDPFNRSVSADQVSENITIKHDPEMGEDAPETKLNLKLFGLRYDSSDLGESSAMLQTPDGQQKNYYIGDEIINGTVLASVSRNFAVLETEGRLEKLSPQRSSVTSVIGVLDDDGEVLDLREAELAELEQQRIAANARRAQKNAKPTPSQMAQINSTEGLQTRAGFTFEEFMRTHRISPVIENNRLSGYELIQTRPGIDLSRFGLQSGDVLTKIGQTDLRQGQPNLPKLLDEMSNGSINTLSVLRGGQSVNVKVDTQ